MHILKTNTLMQLL